MAAGGAARATVHQEAMAEAQPVSFIFYCLMCRRDTKKILFRTWMCLIAKRLFVLVVSMQSIYAS